MGVHFDTTEVDRLAADISRAPGRMQRAAPRVLLASAKRIKTGMRRDFRGHRYAPHIPRAVEYDRIGPMEYEIGVDKQGPQGGLGNILAYGTSNNAPVVDHTASLRRDIPKLTSDFGDAAEDSVLGAERG